MRGIPNYLSLTHLYIGLLGLLPAAPADAQVDLSRDWWQWGGPRRDFIVQAPPLDLDWSAAPPKEVFRVSLWGGHSTVSVSHGQIFVLHGRDRREWVTRFDQDGKRSWEQSYEVAFGSSIASHDGPHAAPLVWEDLVITVAIDASVRAWKRDGGEMIWRRDLRAEHGISLPQAGYAASPLLDGDAILLPGLGADGPDYSRVEAPGLGVLRLDARTGETIWRKQAFTSSHASPIRIADEQPLAVFHGMEKLVAIDPASGAERWQFPLRSGAADNVSFTPIWDSDRRQLLVSHAYDRRGAQAIRLDAALSQPQRIWSNPKLKVEHGNGLIWDGMLLASDRSEPGFLVAVDLGSGETLWKERLPKATLVGVEGQAVLLLDEDGVLYVAQPTRDGLGVRSEFEVLDGLAWTSPTLWERTLYVRDRETLVALRLFAIPVERHAGTSLLRRPFLELLQASTRVGIAGVDLECALPLRRRLISISHRSMR